ncbi:MAG: serine protease [Polyangiales bacterium]
MVFLVAPDLVMTAGHCAARGCNEGAIVFGLDRARAESAYSPSEVYRCMRVEARMQSEGYDWALLRLDRATPLPPLQLAASDPAEGTHVALIGHGLGLPQQAVLGGVVLNEGPRSFFVTDLDAFGGTSGSPVFSMETREVVGILASGGYDLEFDEQAQCLRSVRCDETSGTGFGLECPGNRVTTLELVREEFARLGADPFCTTSCADAALRPGECRSGRECVGFCAQDTGCNDACKFPCDAYGYDDDTCREGWSCVGGCVVQSGCSG